MAGHYIAACGDVARIYSQELAESIRLWDRIAYDKIRSEGGGIGFETEGEPEKTSEQNHEEPYPTNLSCHQPHFVLYHPWQVLPSGEGWHVRRHWISARPARSWSRNRRRRTAAGLGRKSRRQRPTMTETCDKGPDRRAVIGRRALESLQGPAAGQQQRVSAGRGAANRTSPGQQHWRL